MATIQSALQLYDGWTGPLNTITRALSSTLNCFESLQDASGRAIDTAAFQDARDSLAQMEVAFNSLEHDIAAAQKKQESFNAKIRDGDKAAKGLKGTLSKMVSAYALMAAGRKALDWTQGSIELSNIQTNMETQLKTVLANTQDFSVPELEFSMPGQIHLDGSVATGSFNGLDAAYDRLRQKAEELQGSTMYDATAMLGGAAELGTYLSDLGAIETMMGALTDYAAGMSGGGELSASQMVDYATQLGKALEGSYDGLTRKGFVLSDQQKEIIENGSDMERALVLDDVIAQSWAGLAEAMANTPQGKIIQVKNAISSIRQEVGNRLYPKVMQFMAVVQKHMPTIEAMMYNFGQAVGVVVVIASWLMDVAMGIASVFVDNWCWIEPIVWGIVAALVVYNSVLGVAWLTTLKSAAALVWKTACSWANVVATFAMTAATEGLGAAVLKLNAKLYACPLVWILLIIILIVAAIYLLVAVINKWKGTTISATGVIMGAFLALSGFIYNNCFVPLQNGFAILANFVGNVFKDPIASIKLLFLQWAKSVTGQVLSVAKAIEALVNKLPGAHLDITSGIQRIYSGFAKSIEEVKENSAWEELVKPWDHWDLEKAAKAGYNIGQEIDHKTKDIFSGMDFEQFEFEDLGGGIEDYMEEIAGNTGRMANSIEMSGEDLKYLRDIAERDAINRYTTAEITINQTNNNQINDKRDVDGLVAALSEEFAEMMYISAEGVHA